MIENKKKQPIHTYSHRTVACYVLFCQNKVNSTLQLIALMTTQNTLSIVLLVIKLNNTISSPALGKCG